MKLAFTALNLFAAAGFVVLGLAATAIHSTHCYSTYREFVVTGAISEEKLEALHDPDHPEATGYDMQAKMRQAGNAETWLTRISTLAAVTCVLNAAGVHFLTSQYKQSIPDSLSR